MSELTDKMNAALANLEAKLTAGGLTADEVTAQIHTVVDPQITGLTNQLAAIIASEADDASKLAEVTNAVTAFTVAFAPAAPAEPAPTASATSPVDAGDATADVQSAPQA